MGDLRVGDAAPRPARQIHFGNSFSGDGYQDRKFDYLLANPPFGVEWKKVKDEIEDEAELGHGGRFGAGLPRINDGSFLFLQHMLSKMQPVEDRGIAAGDRLQWLAPVHRRCRVGRVRIRRWILENDWLEGIVALPDQLFYNTGISTYFWILSNRKPAELRGKVILLDARDQWEKLRKSLGDKRKEISEDQIKHVTELYANALAVAADASHPDHGKVKIFGTRDFGYRRITVERPLKLRFEITEDTLAALESLETARQVGRPRRSSNRCVACLARSGGRRRKQAPPCARPPGRRTRSGRPRHPCSRRSGPPSRSPTPKARSRRKDGNPLPDPDLRDYENVPLDEDIDTYFEREVKPHVPDAWIDYDKTKIGYEIPFTRHFYVYTPPRPLAEIDAELRDLEAQIQKLLGEVTR